MHDGVTLGGPVWLFAQLLILSTLILSVFVLVDSVRPARRQKATAREPLWVYTALMVAYLGLLVVVQLIPGLNLASAVVSISTPFALALGVTYLLRVVYPKTPSGARGDDHAA